MERGHIASHEVEAPIESNRFKARLFWMGKRHLNLGERYRLKLATQELDAEIVSIEKIIDAGTLETVAEARNYIAKNDVAEVTIDGCETDVGHLVEPLQFVHHDCADFVGSWRLSTLLLDVTRRTGICVKYVVVRVEGLRTRCTTVLLTVVLAGSAGLAIASSAGAAVVDHRLSAAALDTLGGIAVKVVHVTELRTAVDAVRTLADLPGHPARALARSSFFLTSGGGAYSRLLKISFSSRSHTESINVAVSTFNSEE